MSVPRRPRVRVPLGTNLAYLYPVYVERTFDTGQISVGTGQLDFCLQSL